MPRMALREPTYISETKPHRFPKGAVLDVDEETAVRWLEAGVAEPSARSEQTYKEKRRAELAAELEALENEPVNMVTLSNDTSAQRQKRRPGQKAKPGRKVGRAPLMAQSVVMSGPSAETSGNDEGDED